MLLPYGIQHDRADAELAVETIKSYGESIVIEHNIDIKPSVDALVADLYTNGQEISDFNKGNIKARRTLKCWRKEGSASLYVFHANYQ